MQDAITAFLEAQDPEVRQSFLLYDLSEDVRIAVELIEQLRIGVMHIFGSTMMIDCPFANLRNNQRQFICWPYDEKESAYHLSGRAIDEYQERFPQLDQYLLKGKNVAELGPGFGGFTQYARKKKCNVTTIDNAPFESIALAAEFAINTQQIECQDQIHCLIGDQVVVQGLAKQAREYVNQEGKLHYNADFPSLLDTKLELCEAFDVVVELNGPSVSQIPLFEFVSTADLSQILQYPEFRVYIQHLLRMLKPDGRLLWSIGERYTATINSTKQEIQECLVELS